MGTTQVKTHFWQTLRFRLALWIAGLLCIVFVIFSTFVYTNLKNGLMAAVDDSLRLTASQAISTLNLENGQINFSDSVPEGSTASDLAEHGLTTRILSTQGTILEAYGPYASLPISPNTIAAAQEHRTLFYTISDSIEGDPIRFYSSPIIENNQLAGIVQVAQSLGPETDTLARLLTAILLGAPLLIGIAGFGGYFLAAQTLAPIDKITRTAQRISAEDLSARLDIPGTNDEVGRLAATFDNMIQRLDNAFKRERQFTSDASHELRTPLSAMQAIIGVIRQERRTPEDYEQALDDLSEETDRLKILTVDLLKLARNDAINTMAFEEVNITSLVSDLIDSLRPLAEEKGLTITADFDKDVIISGDSDNLIRLFVNLVDNAIKYTSKGGIVVSIPEPANNFVKIIISDSGEGIPSADLPHIFERFYRVSKSRSKRGSGLGLSIADQICRAHGGRITVDSQIGSGTTFIVILPINRNFLSN